MTKRPLPREEAFVSAPEKPKPRPAAEKPAPSAKKPSAKAKAEPKAKAETKPKKEEATAQESAPTRPAAMKAPTKAGASKIKFGGGMKAPAKPAETPAAATPKKPSIKKKTPEAPKAVEAKPVETPVETPAAPAAKKPSTKKKATAAPAAPEPKVETPTAPAPKKSTSKKPKVEKEEPLPERPADSKFKSRTTPASKRGVFTNKAGTRYVADVKAQKALDAALKSGDPARIRSARAKWNALKQTKNFKRIAAGVAGGSAALGTGGAIVGIAPGSKEALSKAGAKKGYQAGEGNGRLSGLYARQARAAKAETPEAPPKKKFGVAGESKFIKGRSAVRQSTIDQITKQGMAKSLAAVKSRKNDPEYIEAIRRFYGAKRLKEALKG